MHGHFYILFSAVFFPVRAYSSYVNALLIVPSLFFQIIRTMPPRRNARNATRGRGCGRDRGHGRGDVNQQVNNEEVNQGNGEVEGAEEHSVAIVAPVGGGANAPVQVMTFTRWMSMRLDTFDGSRMPTAATDRMRTRWSGDGCWA